MKEDTNILKLLEFDNYIKNLNNKNLTQQQSFFLKNEVMGKIPIDGVYYSGDYASVYFKSISSFDQDSLIRISEIHKTIWNQRKVPFLYVSTPTELRVYNCFKEPINPNTNLDDLEQLEIAKYNINDAREHLKKIVSLLGRAAIDSGKVWKEKEIVSHFNISSRIDKKIVQNLKEAKIALVDRNIPVDIIHNLLTRSLFILYLEDIKATGKKYYQQVKKGATSYFHILTDKNATYKLFKALEEKFNGNLFSISATEIETVNNEELSIVASCFWGNEIETGQQALWKIFDFSVIPIELLSEIYEIFLNKTDKEKSKSGEYYTPHSLVDLILNESLPWANNENTKYELKILDLACGSGIFLVESYRRLVDRWIFVNKKQPEFKDLETILLNSIYGFEINRLSIKAASFSLYLALISFLDPKTIWQQETTKFPNLIFDPKRKNKTKQGKNLFLQSSLSNTIEHQPKFDLIVGNPPFKSAKTGSLKPEESEYCNRYDFAQEMVLPFLHRASKFCNENGKVSIVSTSKILFNKSEGYQKFREFLFQDNYVEAVFNFSALRKPKKGQGKSIFANAVGPSCVLFYQKNYEQKKDTITYVCPKPTERDRFADNLVLDELDYYYLPRHECEKPDTIIWKVGMWGTENDFYLIKNFIKQKKLKHFINKKRGWYSGGGFQFLSKDRKKIFINEDIGNHKIMIPGKVLRYYTDKQQLIDINNSLSKKNIEYYLKLFKGYNLEKLPRINVFRMKGKIEAFQSPHLLIKKGQSKGKFTASFVDYYCPYKDGVYGISFNKNDLDDKLISQKTNILKALTAYLNSKFVSYYLFLFSMSWGIEREQIMFNEIKELPALPFVIPKEKVSELAQKVDEISEELAKDFPNQEIIEIIEKKIDGIIYQALNLTEREKYLIEDVLNYSIDLFQEGEKSPAYFPINQYNDELKAYLRILCEDINEHFEFSGTNVWASIQEMPVTNPMRLVAIHFSDEHKAGQIEIFPNSSEINKLIRKIDEYSFQKHSASVYFRKVVKYYEGDIIYFIKPNQKRFWSRAQAMQDSSSILLEMANMSEE